MVVDKPGATALFDYSVAENEVPYCVEECFESSTPLGTVHCTATYSYCSLYSPLLVKTGIRVPVQ